MVGITQFQLLLLALCSTGLILSPCLLSDTSVSLLSGSSAGRATLSQLLQGGELRFQSSKAFYRLRYPCIHRITQSVCRGLQGVIVPRARRHTYLVLLVCYSNADTHLADAPLTGECLKGTVLAVILAYHASIF